MKIIGSLSVFVILAVLIVFQPIAFSSSSLPDDGLTEDELYQAYVNIYFVKQELDQTREMSVRESFLKWLYDGIISEVQSRKKKSSDQTLEILNPPGLQGFDENSYKLPENLEESSPKISNSAREKYLRDEYRHKYLKARLIKDKLIATATDKQRKRLLKKDLNSTIDTYMYGRYTEAILKFDELIKEYGFTDLDDIYFYRGESYFAMKLWSAAIQDFERVVSSNSLDSHYQKTSLNRLISLYGNMGYYDKVKEHWEAFQGAYSEELDDEYWQVVEVVARYMMVAGELTNAISLIDQIPQTSEVYINSHQLAAQSALMQLELDDAESRFNALNVPKIGNTKISSNIQNDARLKLGYVRFLRGDYRDAHNMFRQVEGNAKHKEIALISSAWSLYRINVFDQVIATCDMFITQFPNSEYKYEALALMGHCREVLGQDTLAVDLFEEIMSAVDDRLDYRDFVYEKKQISNLSNELSLIESEVFGENRRDLFNKYLSVREKLISLKEEVKLAEGLRSNPEIGDMIVEQARLVRLIEGQQDIENLLGSLDHKRSILKYQNILTSLDNLTSKISHGINYELSRSNVTQREEKRRHEAILSDSLARNTVRELQSIDNSLVLVHEIRNNMYDDSSPELLLELTTLNDDLHSMRQNLLHIQTDLSSYGQVELTSNLDEWSDFAYLRYTYGGLDFDNFAAQQDRIVELDSYIQKLSKILSERNRASSDMSNLSDALVLASSPGDDPYNAPPIPLWGEVVMSNDQNVRSVPNVESVSDTSVVDESPESNGLDDSEITGDQSKEEQAIPTDGSAEPLENEQFSPETGEQIEQEDEAESTTEDGDVSPDPAIEEQKPKGDETESEPEAGEISSDPKSEEQVPLEDDQDGAKSTPIEGEDSPSPENEINPESSIESQGEEKPADVPESSDTDGKQKEPDPAESQGDEDGSSSVEKPSENNKSDENVGDVPLVEPDQDPSKEDPTQP